MNPSMRRHARQYALQAMYQWQISSAPIMDIETEFLVMHIKNKTDLDYFKELLHGIPRKCDELDAQIAPHLDRPITDLDPIELAILRIATYELQDRPDVPYKVVINEALELTKSFGSIEGYKFVNGVLDHVAKKLRAVEVQAVKHPK